MSNEMAQKLVQGGIKAVKNGETELARKAFTQALKLDPNNEAAWLGMATITEASKDKIRILKKVLEINPENDKAQEALRRLEVADAPAAMANPFSAAIDDADSFEESMDEIPMPPLPGESMDEIPMPPLPGESMDEAEFVEAVAPVDAGEEIPQGVEEPIILKTAAEAFAELPAPPSMGQGGTPIVNPVLVQDLSQQTLEEIQSYLEEMLADYLSPETTWTKKRRGRAGESEYPIFIGQVTAGVFAFLVLLGIGAVVFVLNSPEAQKLLFAPTFTPSNTPTVTPSITPGVTNTPSVTPSLQASPSPTLNITITPGNPDQFFPPTPTEAYYPVVVNQGLEIAVDNMLRGNMDTAFTQLQAEIDTVVLSGEFPPYYRLSQWYLLNGQPEEARQVLVSWEEEWQNATVYANSLALLLTAYARVDVYEAQNGLGDRTVLLNTAEGRLDTVLGITNPRAALDRLIPDAHILLAQILEARGDIDAAVDSLNETLTISFQGYSFLTSTEIYYEKARILGDAGRTGEALQTLNRLLTIDPFNEAALIYQIQLALDSNQAGLAVLYAQQYLLYYPGSVQGFYLLGQAREAENKIDLAINAYSRAVAGDPTDTNYTSDPFFLEALLRRAEIYTEQGNQALAANDYQLALRVSDEDEAIRVRSLESNYASGNYDVVLEDAADLLDAGDVPSSQVQFYQGRAYIELANEENSENYQLGIDALEAAISGLSGVELAEAQDYLARANFALENYTPALEAVNAAIEVEATSSRRFLRAQILEAEATRSGRNQDFVAALLDYEYILTWAKIYPFPFTDAAEASYQAIVTRLGGR